MVSFTAVVDTQRLVHEHGSYLNIIKLHLYDRHIGVFNSLAKILHMQQSNHAIYNKNDVKSVTITYFYKS